MALSFRLARPCFGATIAIRRDRLAQIGGFSRFADDLAEDYSIGEAVRLSGYEVAIPTFSVAHVCLESSLEATLEQQLGLARTIKSIDPVGYCGSIITHPLPLALLGAFLGGTDSAFLVAVAFGCRHLLALAVKRAFGLAAQPAWLIPIQDVIAFSVYVMSFFGTTVSWRGHKYRVLPDGKLVHDQSPGAP
jgi:ceramide glucosyltransferase